MNYSLREMKRYIDNLSHIFDKIRLVDPIKRRVLVLMDDSGIGWEDYVCHKIWNKEERCENCISIHALQLDKRLTKFEFANNEVFFVVAKPVEVMLEDGTIYRLVMEILCMMTDEVFFEAYERNTFESRIAMVEKKIYEDPLTKVYNRRFFDERMFLYHSQGKPIDSITFIMVDLHDFKNINDTFGHAVGDAVLIQVANVLQASICDIGAVVRMGGDEFLIILTNCEPRTAEKVIARIKEKMEQEIRINTSKEYRVVADFGISHSPSFVNSPDCIEQLLEVADKKMYLDKNGTCLWEMNESLG